MATDTSSGNRFNITPGLKSEAFRAAELGVHRITLLRARKSGALGFVRIGDRVFFAAEHIVQWLEANERPAKKAA